MALCLIDLDDFKALNDTHGQAVGDLLLKQVAQRLGEVPAATAVLARLAGDEFVLLAPLARLSQAQNLAADLLDTFREPFLLDKESFL
ncbi:hypothetical protein BH24DEI2_BH24DEI2_02230 [soil metagenome]